MPVSPSSSSPEEHLGGFYPRIEDIIIRVQHRGAPFYVYRGCFRARSAAGLEETDPETLLRSAREKSENLRSHTESVSFGSAMEEAIDREDNV